MVDNNGWTKRLATWTNGLGKQLKIFVWTSVDRNFAELDDKQVERLFQWRFDMGDETDMPLPEMKGYYATSSTEFQRIR
jgi:hypothetical protein